jgi:hypothetical protein
LGAAPRLGSRLTALRVLGPICLAALAILVAILAADVRSWSSSVAAGDAIYAASPARASWTPSTRLGGLAGDLLGVHDDVALRRALQLYDSVAGLRLRLDNAVEVETARAQAQDALITVARGSDRQRASQAETLLGINAFAASKGTGTSSIDTAVSAFTEAVRADPGNDDAKFDLELLLRMAAPHGKRAGRGQGGPSKGSHRGADGGTTGRGY